MGDEKMNSESENQIFGIVDDTIENREFKRKKSKKLNCKKCGQKNCPNHSYKEKLLCSRNQYTQKMYSDNRFYQKYIAKKDK